jgi:hypothetical protein
VRVRARQFATLWQIATAFSLPAPDISFSALQLWCGQWRLSIVSLAGSQQHISCQRNATLLDLFDHQFLARVRAFIADLLPFGRRCWREKERYDLRIDNGDLHSCVARQPQSAEI